MFDLLSSKFNEAFRRLSGKSRISEANVREIMVEIRKALIEADVSFAIARKFCDDVVAKALGQKVTQSLRPDELMVKIVFEELAALMGPADAEIPFASPGPTVIMLAGLQGAGKTTTAGKLARYIRDEKRRRVLLVAADLQRPAAVEQLQTLGGQLDISVYTETGQASPVTVCRNAISHARREGVDVVILDTAGRLAIDEPLMAELEAIVRTVSPHQRYLVIDAMIGQNAVATAKAFNDRLELDGVILTKLDGDTRGGAAMTVRAVTGKPIKFCGMGEKLDRLEVFNPEQMATRLLGKPDLLGIFDRARQVIDQEKAAAMREQMARGRFTLAMFVEQLQQVRKMGSMQSLLGMLGMGSQLAAMGEQVDDRELDRVIAIVRSMTPKERDNPDIIETNRRKRIARGSGTTPEDVSQLVKSFAQMRPMMESMSKMNFLSQIKAVSQLSQMDLFSGGGKLPDIKKVVNDENSRRQKEKEKLRRRDKRR